MANEKILAEIERLERLSFILNMKDHWSIEDQLQMNAWNNEIQKLKAQLV